MEEETGELTPAEVILRAVEAAAAEGASLKAFALAAGPQSETMARRGLQGSRTAASPPGNRNGRSRPSLRQDFPATERNSPPQMVPSAP